MANHWCLNGVMKDTDRYSSPVPLVGLYTAAATFVCLALIISDISAAFRHKKTWVPCRFFSLNSITLTLIAISTKLPVDLTSPMPSSQDQLSKLTGTVFICMTMGFLTPSMGTMREFECYSNLVALTIFVITLVVNISIQIAIGVIFSFVAEHFIILVFMLVLNIALWVPSLSINDYKETCFDQVKRTVTDGTETSLLQRVEVGYLCGYNFNPQFYICRVPISGVVGFICTACLVVLGEVVFRSVVFKDLKFCQGVSAYGWSMWIVVGIQLLTILFLAFAIGCRWLNFVNATTHATEKKRNFYRDHPYLGVASSVYMPEWLGLAFLYVGRYFWQPIVNLVLFSFYLFTKIILGPLLRRCKCMPNHQDSAISTENFKHLLEAHNLHFEEWTMRKAVADMETQMKMSRKKFPQHLRNLLSTYKPSLESLTQELKTATESSNLSCLSIILLVEMARVSFPASHGGTKHLVEVVNDVFEIIYFIDGKINNVGGFNSKLKSLTARVLWKGKATSFVIDSRSCRNDNQGMVLSHDCQSDLDHALGAVEEFHKSFVDQVVRDEAQAIVKFIQRRAYTSLDDLYDQIKSLLVDMLHEFLSQFPQIIYNHIAESTVEEYDKRIELALRYICKLESVEAYVRWSFPSKSNISCLINAQVSSSANTPVPGEDSNVNLCTTTTTTVLLLPFPLLKRLLKFKSFGKMIMFKNMEFKLKFHLCSDPVYFLFCWGWSG